MSGPDRVRLKRRRDELPPDTLIVEPHLRAAGTGEDGAGYAQKRRFTPLEYKKRVYVRQPTFKPEPTPSTAVPESRLGDGEAGARVGNGPVGGDDQLRRELEAYGRETQAQQLQEQRRLQEHDRDRTLGTEEVLVGAKRTFHLKRSAAVHDARGDGGSRKRQARDDRLATFEERKERGGPHLQSAAGEKKAQNPADLEPGQKRPGRGARVQRQQGNGMTRKEAGADVGKDQGAAQAVADRLHEFALEEMAREPKPKITAVPRLPPQRSRELHLARAAASSPKSSIEEPASDSMDIDDESDFIYDTYVLAPTSSTGATATAALQEHALGSVGYLVITDEDAPIWERYALDSDNSGDGSERGDYNSDEDDENAEDYYGADYPEDELASDDEFDSNAYGYRRGVGSDDEQWDANAATWSGDDEEEVRRRNPFAKPVRGRFAKYLNGAGKEDGESSEDGLEL